LHRTDYIASSASRSLKADENETELQEIQQQLQALESVSGGGAGGRSRSSGAMQQEAIDVITERTHAVDAQRRENDALEAKLRKLKAATVRAMSRPCGLKTQSAL
jgi:hypothetical protein